MIVNFPSSEEFDFKPCQVAGEDCLLINPGVMSINWTKDNLIFRSVMVNSQKEIISAGLPKFMNAGERPDICALPNDLTGCIAVEKLDGSLVSVSKYKGEFIIRTRGSPNVDNLTTGHEIKQLVQKYGVFGFCLKDTWDFSLIFEYTSPSWKIVINYGDKPDLKLIGKINHEDYSLAHQIDLDDIALKLRIGRPKYYYFTSIEQMIYDIKNWKGQEGIVLYLPERKGMLKIKSSHYLLLHGLKSNLNSDKLADMFFELNQPIYEDFCNLFEKQWDFETFMWAKLAIDEFYDSVQNYLEIVQDLKDKVQKRKDWSRKEFAIAAQQEFTGKKFSLVMELYLDKKPKTSILKDILMEQIKPIKMGIFEN